MKERKQRRRKGKKGKEGEGEENCGGNRREEEGAGEEE